MRGRRQQSNTLKALRGLPVPNNPEAKPLISIRCPSWLKGDARRLWQQLAPGLAKQGLLTSADKAAFEGLCISYGLMLVSAQKLLAGGLSCRAERGGPAARKKLPEFTAWKSASDNFQRYCSAFGLTPASRQLLDVKAEQPLTALQAYAQSRRKFNAQN